MDDLPEEDEEGVGAVDVGEVVGFMTTDSLLPLLLLFVLLLVLISVVAVILLYLRKEVYL